MERYNIPSAAFFKRDTDKNELPNGIGKDDQIIESRTSTEIAASVFTRILTENEEKAYKYGYEATLVIRKRRVRLLKKDKLEITITNPLNEPTTS